MRNHITLKIRSKTKTFFFVNIIDNRSARVDFHAPLYQSDNSLSSSISSSSDYDSGYQRKGTYGPPSYEPPKPVYGPPPSHPVYYHTAPPAHHHYPTVYNAPREDHWLLNKLKLKLDFFTIGKILLKLIIFKKIVKFLALICLLLFLPKLQSHTTTSDNDDDDIGERRQLDIKCKFF